MKGKQVVGQDAALREELLFVFHNSATEGQAGAKVTMKRLGSVCYWKGLKKRSRSFFRLALFVNNTNIMQQLILVSCSHCQSLKGYGRIYPEKDYLIPRE